MFVFWANAKWNGVAEAGVIEYKKFAHEEYKVTLTVTLHRSTRTEAYYEARQGGMMKFKAYYILTFGETGQSTQPVTRVRDSAIHFELH